jgi:hypothetical protein
MYIRLSNKRLIVNHRYFELAYHHVENRMTPPGMIIRRISNLVEQQGEHESPKTRQQYSWYADLLSPMNFEACPRAIQYARMVLSVKRSRLSWNESGIGL